MHEFRTGRSGDPDKTKPPTRVETLWGATPPGAAIQAAPRHRPRPRAAALSDNDAFTLYRAARDCMSAGAYTGATALLRRLILHVTVASGNQAGTREEAERLLEVAETLLGLHRGGSRRSNA